MLQANEMETRRDASEAFYIVEQVASQVKAVDNKKVTACIAGTYYFFLTLTDK